MINNYINFKLNVVMIVVFLFTFTAMVLAEDIEVDGNYEQVAENDYLQLFIDKESTEIMLKDKESGQVWFTNPPYRDEQEKVASNYNKEQLGAQLLIKFFAPGDKYIVWDNRQESIAYNQFSIKPIENGIRIDYLIGKKWDIEDYIPTMIDKEFLENEILTKLNEEEREFVLKNFWLCHLEKNQKSVEEYSFTEVSARFDVKELFQDYIMKLKQSNGQEIELTAHGNENGFPSFMKENSLKYILGNIVTGKGYMFISDLAHDDIMVLKEPVYILKESIFNWDKKRLGEILRDINLSPTSIAEQHNKYQIEPPHENIRLFKVPMEYRLAGKDLLVKVPLEEVEYPANVIDYTTEQSVTMPLVSINILPFFGAGSTEDEGYMFIPDGSGALIDFNNGRVNLPEYHKFVYDEQLTLSEKKMNSDISEKIRMPVYGIKNNDQAFLAVIEEGDSLAEIRAKVANDINSYNTVNSQFHTIPYTTMKLVGVSDKGADINIYQSRKSSGSIQLRYMLMDGNKANYSGMAEAYRNYLQDKYNWSRTNEGNDLPFLLEVMGNYQKKMPRLGVSLETVLPLTTFKETEKLIGELKNRGIKNIDLLYNGWLSGGIEHKYPNKIRVEKKMGGENDFRSLIDFIHDQGMDFYPEVSMLNIYNNSIFDSFNWYKHNARLLEGGQAKSYSYNQATYRWEPEEYSYLLSPRYLGSLMDGFLNDYEKFSLDKLSFRNIGKEYYSDFRRDPEELVDRGESVSIISRELEKIADKELAYMVRGGNMPSVYYSNYVVEAPMYGGADNLINRGIPFYQMVLHGYVKYSGEPINLTANPQLEFLKIIETGAVPYFRGSYRESDLLKQSNFNENYAIFYQDWIEKAAKYYKRINKDFKGLEDQSIVEHKQLTEKLYQIVYENGDSIVVNYGTEPVMLENKLIKANDYQLFREGGRQ